MAEADEILWESRHLPHLTPAAGDVKRPSLVSPRGYGACGTPVPVPCERASREAPAGCSRHQVRNQTSFGESPYVKRQFCSNVSPKLIRLTPSPYSVLTLHITCSRRYWWRHHNRDCCYRHLCLYIHRLDVVVDDIDVVIIVVVVISISIITDIFILVIAILILLMPHFFLVLWVQLTSSSSDVNVIKHIFNTTNNITEIISNTS